MLAHNVKDPVGLLCCPQKMSKGVTPVFLFLYEPVSRRRGKEGCTPILCGLFPEVAHDLFVYIVWPGPSQVTCLSTKKAEK